MKFVVLPVIAFLLTWFILNLPGSDNSRVTIHCEGYPSVEECIKEGVAPNWRQLKGIEFEFVEPEK